MKTIEEHNNEVINYHDSKKCLSGIECPNCKKELHYKNSNIVLLSYPPQKEVVCFECGYSNTVYNY